MDKLDSAVNEVNSIYELSQRNKAINNINPLSKLIVTIWYIVSLVSFDKFNLIGILPMVIFPVCLFILGDIPFAASVKRLRLILPLVCLVGVTNPIFESTRIIIYGRAINAGYISMMTLIIKGMLAVFASYLLIATTSIEKICYALRLIKCPKIIVTEILLIYRYITLFIYEVREVSNAYALRAPWQKGVNIKHWGSFAGSILLRSFDKAKKVFESMNMRGYNGEFSYAVKDRKIKAIDVLYVLIWAAVFVIFKRVPIVILIGNIVGGIIA